MGNPYNNPQDHANMALKMMSLLQPELQGGASATTNNMNEITGLLSSKPTQANHQAVPYNNFTAYYGGHGNDLGS
jgi:hypothetical protein